ncbi:pilin [Bacillus bombysepticus]|uniref:pilin n=1 Tax=Bacillus bombysepticus TaxID=658666 RepID=UPI003016F782
MKGNVSNGLIPFWFVVILLFSMMGFINSPVFAADEKTGQGCQLVVDPKSGKWSQMSSDGKYTALGDQSSNNSQIAACESNAKEFRTKIMRLLTVVASLSIAGAFATITYAGYMYITSGGNQRNIETAKKQLFYASIGLFIIACGSMIVKLYVDSFGG